MSPPTVVNMHEAKTHLSRLVERVEGGEEIVIGRAGNRSPSWCRTRQTAEAHRLRRVEGSGLDRRRLRRSAPAGDPRRLLLRVRPRPVRLLLDTHVMLWWLNRDRRLSQTGSIVHRQQADQVLVSAASAWEIAIKRAVGKLEPALRWHQDDRRVRLRTAGHHVRSRAGGRRAAAPPRRPVRPDARRTGAAGGADARDRRPEHRPLRRRGPATVTDEDDHALAGRLATEAGELLVELRAERRSRPAPTRGR